LNKHYFRGIDRPDLETGCLNCRDWWWEHEKPIHSRNKGKGKGGKGKSKGKKGKKGSFGRKWNSDRRYY